MKKTTKILMMASLLMGAVAFGSTTASARSHRHAQGQDHRQEQKHFNKHERKHAYKNTRKHFSKHNRRHAYEHNRRHYRKSHNHYATNYRRYKAPRIAYIQPEIHITPYGVVLQLYPDGLYRRSVYLSRY
ncbi:MAG: hypothetical protein COB49_02310 [Alphaproteobacteria bacterium]|nr:MAG: hypothetical protein COB49_02310 [Alphaproteobacteria bacterium]